MGNYCYYYYYYYYYYNLDTVAIRSYPEIAVRSFGGFVCSLNEQPFTPIHNAVSNTLVT